jgi:transposase
MKYIQGENRKQIHLFTQSLDEIIESDNEVRLIDAFVEHLDIEEYGFEQNRIENGRPAYHPKTLLKLYIYGYLNRIRSSRQLEKETKRNIELMWLLQNLNPDHNTISNFRRDNNKAIRKVFRKTVEIAQYFNLIGKKLIAGDSTKLRAQNSKKNNFNEKKIKQHLAYIDNKLQEYENQISDEQNELSDEEKEVINQKIEKHIKKKEQYKKLQKQLDDSKEKQISTSDPQSRQMITRNNITEVCYNIQVITDDKNKIPIDYKVTNQNDKKAMGMMLRRTKTILRTNRFAALFDKGYHTGSEFQIAGDLGIDVMVAIPKPAANAPNHKYNVEHFQYNKTDDYYTCPQGEKLTTTGKWHKAKTYRFKRYTTKSCKTCPVKVQCSKAKYGKAIQRSEYQELIDKNKKRIEKNKEYYRKRQQIVEHPFGTIKRQWGFDHIMTKKTIERAESDTGLILIAYNLRRIINIIGFKTLLKYLMERVSLNFSIITQNKAILSRYKPLFFPSNFIFQNKKVLTKVA